MLTDNQLDMIKRLQPFFREKMGRIIHGDFYYNELFKEITPVAVIHEASNGWNDSRLICPKPIDWQNPERGLWGMIHEQKKFVSLLKSEKGCACQVYKLDSPTLYSYEAPDPFTALLKALCEQEGV